MANIQLVDGGLVVIAGVTYIATANGQGGFDLTESTRKPLNYDAETGVLTDDNDVIVGRMNFRSKMASDAIPELGANNVTVVVSDAYADGYDLTVAKVSNTNKKANPDWAEGATIGTRQEWALFLTKKED